MPDCVVVENREAVRIVRMNRPDKKNALIADEDNPEAYAVTEINTWNKAVLEQLARTLQDEKQKGLKQTLGGSKYEMTYVWNDALYIFTYNKDVPVRLSVHQLVR